MKSNREAKRLLGMPYKLSRSKPWTDVWLFKVPTEWRWQLDQLWWAVTYKLQKKPDHAELTEPSFDAPQSEWDEYERKHAAIHGKADLSPTLTTFKSIDDQKAERYQERMEQQARVEALLPMPVVRSMRQRVDDELAVAAGRYVDGGVSSEQQSVDARRFNEFMTSATAEQKRALSLSEHRYRLSVAGGVADVKPQPAGFTVEGGDNG